MMNDYEAVLSSTGRAVPTVTDWGADGGQETDNDRQRTGVSLAVM